MGNDGIDLNDFFGQPKTGSDGSWTQHNLKEDEPNVFRIAPPVKSLRASGRWRIYDSLHYGYTVPNEKNPDKPFHKPFRCVKKKNRATGLLEQDCPECNYIESKKQEVEALKAKAIAGGKTPEQAEEWLKPVKKFFREHNLDKKWYVLAKNLAGEWGTLRIPYKAMQQVDDLIEKYIKNNDGSHPLDSREGVWFRFNKQGTGLDTRYAVEIETESVGKGQFKVKSGVLTQIDKEGIERAPDLATVNDNKSLTYDQIAALVASNGDPQIVSTVFGQPTRNVRVPPPKEESAELEEVVSTPVVVQPAVATPTPSSDDTIAKLLAEVARLQAAQVSSKDVDVRVTTPPVVVTKTEKVPNFTEAMSMDPATFLKMFPDPNKR